MSDVQAQTGAGLVRAQDTTGLRLEYPIESDSLDADVIVEVLQVTQVPDRRPDLRADLRCAVQRQLDAAPSHSAATRSTPEMPSARVTSACKQSTAPASNICWK